MAQSLLAFVGNPLFLKLSFVAVIVGLTTFLLSFARMSQSQDEQGTLSGSDLAWLELSLGVIIIMLGAFGVLSWYMKKSGRFPSLDGYDSTMLDNIRAEIAAQDIEMLPLTQQSPHSSVTGSTRSFPSTLRWSGFSSFNVLLPVQPEQVHLPPQTLEEQEILIEMKF